MESNVEARLEEIDLNLKKIEELSPEELGAWGRFSNLAAADGALSPRGKEIIAVALSVLAKCQWCIPFHVKKALELGAKKQEIVESAWVAVMMGGSPALMYAQLRAQLVARGVVCNWLVCLAVWTATSAEDTTGKIFACFFPIMAFVASGFEHSVANMFFVPMGIMLKGVPSLVALSNLSLTNLTWSGFIINNLVPVTLGNIIGGGFFVATLYWYVYLRPAARALDMIEELNPALRVRRRELEEE